MGQNANEEQGTTTVELRNPTKENGGSISVLGFPFSVLRFSFT
jgi:hypothetical protein